MSNNPDASLDGDLINNGEEIVITSSKLAKTLLTKNYIDENGVEAAILQTTPKFQSLAKNLLGKESLFMKEGEDHGKLKNFVGGYFNPNDKGRMSQMFVEYSANMMSIADRMANEVSEKFRQGETSVNVYEIFRNSILEFTASSLFGVQLTEKEIVSISKVSEQMIDLENALFRKFEEGNPLLYPSMAWDYLRLNNLNRSTKKSFEKILHRKIDSICQTQGILNLDTKLSTLRANYSGEPRDLLEHMLCNPIEIDVNGNKLYLDSASIQDQMLSLLMAGHITSTSVNTTQIHYLEGQLKYADPEFYAEWESEMRNMDLLIQGLKNGKQWNELKHLHTHRASSALIDESLRMHPINTSTWRMVMQDFEIEHNGTKLEFKKGQTISIDFEGMAKKFNQNLQNPHQFDPRQLIEASARVNQELMPFAYGTHYCLGARIAETEARDIGGRFIFSLHNWGLELQPVEGNMVTGVNESIQLPKKEYRTMKIAVRES